MGDERRVRDSLEYVVFEKHLSDTEGKWRVHGKVTPDWLPRRAEVVRTLRQPAPPREEEADSDDIEEVKAASWWYFSQCK